MENVTSKCIKQYKAYNVLLFLNYSKKNIKVICNL